MAWRHAQRLNTPRERCFVAQHLVLRYASPAGLLRPSFRYARAHNGARETPG